MTELRSLTSEELCPVLVVLTNLPDGTSVDSLPDIAAELGWTLRGRTNGLTNLPVSLQVFLTAGLKNPAGGRELVQVDFRVTDTLRDAGWFGQQLIKGAAPAMVDVISGCLGFAPTRPKRVQPGFTWDLPDGKMVVLDQGDDVIVVQVWAKRLADIERQEIAWGIDPAHDLDDRPA